MNPIIQHLIIQNQYLLQIISFLLKFICKFIPLRKFAFDDSDSPDYQKFKTVKSINRRNVKDVPSSVVCPR